MFTLPARLAALRATAGLSSNELGLLAELSHYTVTTIERSKGGHPRIETVMALASVLGDTGNWILTGVGAPPAQEAIHAAVQRAREAKAARDAAKKSAAEETGVAASSTDDPEPESGRTPLPPNRERRDTGTDG